MAVGSITGALLSARRETPGLRVLTAAALAFGVGVAVAAAMPTLWLFGLALVGVGAAAQTFTTTAISTAQLSTDPAVRGRVMAIMLAVALGGTPIGAPIIGWVVDASGPRWAMGAGAAAGVAAAGLGVRHLRRRAGRPGAPADVRATAAIAGQLE